MKSILPKDFQLDWLKEIEKASIMAEEAEASLSYAKDTQSETQRKQTGSYYTPRDVATYFWNEFFKIYNITDRESAHRFLDNFHFIEPSAGAGSLLFALFTKISSLGVSIEALTSIRLTIIDINPNAITFLQERIRQLSVFLGKQFPNITYHCSDFASLYFPPSKRNFLFFGNPPFAKNDNGSTWKNSFADFIETSLTTAGAKGIIHYIIPLSFSFSRDYKNLRDLLFDHNRKVTLSNYDNIPDTLFKWGKPKNSNSNKANSQRCTILTVIPSQINRVLSTQLLRWSKKERKSFLSTSPTYLDVTKYSFDNQIPRPTDFHIIEYLSADKDYITLKDYCNTAGRYSLYIGTVARNYIGIRESKSTSAHRLSFDTEHKFYVALQLVSSQLFFNYWKTIGDGFHITKSNIHNFPIHNILFTIITQNTPKAARIWEERQKYMKCKLNSGRCTVSYDFTGLFPPLL